ncbi:MAG: pirin family protein [Isosphaeraceae bacterium]
MIRLRRSKERGRFDHGWLKSFHTFSFGRYQDPRFRGFRDLLVMNEDWIAPGAGFPTHPHENREIITLVHSGTLEHRDSLGNGDVIRRGEFQRMTAGTGIEHGEFNPSTTEEVHLHQIWILPEREGLPPSYEQRAIDLEAARDRFLTLASPDGRGGSLTIRANANLSVVALSKGGLIDCAISEKRHAWLQVLQGEVVLNNVHSLQHGDGAAVSDETTLAFRALSDAELLLIDLA